MEEKPYTDNQRENLLNLMDKSIENMDEAKQETLLHILGALYQCVNGIRRIENKLESINEKTIPTRA